MSKMNDPKKNLVLFQDTIGPSLKLMRKHAVKESDFDGFKYSHDFNEEMEVWVKDASSKF